MGELCEASKEINRAGAGGKVPRSAAGLILLAQERLKDATINLDREMQDIEAVEKTVSIRSTVQED